MGLDNHDLHDETAQNLIFDVGGISPLNQNKQRQLVNKVSAEDEDLAMLWPS